MKNYFSLAIKNAQRRKLRSLLTMIGIIISIATIFVLISVSLGLEEAVQEQFRLLGTDKFFIQPRGQAGGPGSQGTVSFTLNDIETIEKTIGVKDSAYSTVTNAQVEFNNKKRFVLAIGFPLDKSDLFTETGAYTAGEGNLFRKTTDRGKVMLGWDYKYRNLFEKPVHAGDKIMINEKEFEVETILNRIGSPTDDRLVYMNIEDFKEVFNIDRIDQIVVKVNEESDIREIADRVERRLRNSRDVTEKTQDFSIFTPEELLEGFGTVLNIVTAFLLGIAAISLLVGSIGIANTMYTSVLERTREIGIMKAIGAKNSDILLIFLIESGLLGLIGGFFGVLLGAGISKFIEYIAINQLGTTLLKAALPPYLFIGCLIFSFAVGAISGIWPAWRASKTKPVDALRYE